MIEDITTIQILVGTTALNAVVFLVSSGQGRELLREILRRFLDVPDRKEFREHIEDKEKHGLFNSHD